ncbi:short chain dehydrogenase reductase [Diaporthe eres]|uniref:Short chain dehydrogenase/reductase n=1 Tax=Diaporthe vaccinii TaxID=105482 RepID=A0ABR4EYY6_9PEZI|nr:short chain dehydrogenase reductase [Diaporthe eres]
MSSLDASALFSVNGLVAVVTGGGTGIGLMIARALEHNGAKVYILGRREEVLKTAARQNAIHGNIIPIVADVTDKASLDAAVAKISEETGYINLLVNNAGTLGRVHNAISRPPPHKSLPSQFSRQTDDDLTNVQGIRDFLWKDEFSDWDNMLRTNVSGVWFPSIAFLGLLDKGNSKENVVQKSQIVTVGSVGAFIRILGTSFSYNPSKAAANHLAKMMATNFVQWGIRSNVIAPGYYPSEMSVGKGKLDENNRNHINIEIPPEEVPLGKVGDEEDMAAAILFLAGKGGKYLNGNVVITDGGRLGISPAVY